MANKMTKAARTPAANQVTGTCKSKKNVENSLSSLPAAQLTLNGLVMERLRPHSVTKVTLKVRGGVEPGLNISNGEVLEDAARTLASIKNHGPKATSLIDQVFNKVMNVHPDGHLRDKPIAYNKDNNHELEDDEDEGDSEEGEFGLI